MKKKIQSIWVAGCLSAFALTAHAQEKLHRIVLKKPADTHQFLRFQANDLPVIAGHRGTVENGYPENSIESMAYTLQFTPAIFELDPRMTKDSVVVLMHDATIDRTTTGKGSIAEMTYRELQQYHLKDVKGNPTAYKAPTLSEVIEWARGKTIINLDQKGVPYEIIADLIKKHKAESFVMITTHSPEHALFYLKRNPAQTFSAHIKTKEEFEKYVKAGVPFNQLMAYIGPHIKETNQELYRLINGKGAMAMISSAGSYDKLPTKAERAEKYRAVIADGATVLESDFPIEVGEALKEMQQRKSKKKKYIRYVQ